MAGATGATVKIKSNRLPAISKALRPKVATVIKQGATDIQSKAQQLVPVLTGTLRRSITAQFPSDLSARIGPSVKYGVFVEMGARGRGAKPYLRPAAEQVLPRMAGQIKSALGDL